MLELLAAVRIHVCVITRLRLDAALYKPAPPRRKGQRGRSRLKGSRLPPLKTVLNSKKTVWTTVVVSQWYNAQQRQLLTATGTALWYKAGVAPVPIRYERMSRHRQLSRLRSLGPLCVTASLGVGSPRGLLP